MAETTPLTHPNAPHNQPFCVGARPNKTKKRSWWNASSDSYWRNANKKKDRKTKADQE